MIISITRPPRQLWTWEYYRQNRTIKLDFMRRQQQVLECFWKSDQKSTLIAGFWTCNEQGTSRGSKPVHIGVLHMGLISHLQQAVLLSYSCDTLVIGLTLQSALADWWCLHCIPETSGSYHLQ